jgi:hypothetical protein
VESASERHVFEERHARFARDGLDALSDGIDALRDDDRGAPVLLVGALFVAQRDPRSASGW